MKKSAKTRRRRNSIKMSILPMFIYGCSAIPVQIRFVLGSGQKNSEKEEQEGELAVTSCSGGEKYDGVSGIEAMWY